MIFIEQFKVGAGHLAPQDLQAHLPLRVILGIDGAEKDLGVEFYVLSTDLQGIMMY